ncbi:Rap1a/Tai family immunity protein [Sphingomonas sp. LK11]|uniref:Rap1a/Tai family immunity protein n=1 Tax=Sphingomonas sp. LK11 TaxID=1390395 RepID=UPI0012EB3DF6|nr:Rap1a/Tai family immunity protein [Sphingomonas sp. LK11]
MGYPRTFHYAAAIALVFLLSPNAASAQSGNDGNELLNDCAVDDTSWKDGFCAGSIQGVIAGMSLEAALAKQDMPFCLREGVTNRQVRDTVVLWLRQNPSKRDLQKSVVVALAMTQGFPCTQK